MDYQLLLKRLNVVIRKKFPKDGNRIVLLAGMLDMKPNTLYRKLKGQRPFWWDELVRVTDALSVSIQDLLVDGPHIDRYSMGLVRSDNLPVKDGYLYAMNATRDVFEKVAGAGYSKFTGVCRSLPIISYFNYGWLLKVAHLKWLYFSRGFVDLPSFSLLGDAGVFGDVRDVYREAFASIKHLTFLVDGDIIRNFTLDLAFFRKINLISRDELMFVLDDLEALLSTARKICEQGMWLDSGNEIQIFYSDMPFYNDIYLLESSCNQVGVFYAQGFNPVIHKDAHTFYVFRDWVDGWIRCSNPICGIADLDRRAFFERQRILVETFRKEQEL